MLILLQYEKKGKKFKNIFGGMAVSADPVQVAANGSAYVKKFWTLCPSIVCQYGMVGFQKDFIRCFCISKQILFD